MSDDEDFEEQIRLQNEEKEKRENLDHGRTKVDEDGTVMEWDADKGAWFPKVWVSNVIYITEICCHNKSPDTNDLTVSYSWLFIKEVNITLHKLNIFRSEIKKKIIKQKN